MTYAWQDVEKLGRRFLARHMPTVKEVEESITQYEQAYESLVGVRPECGTDLICRHVFRDYKAKILAYRESIRDVDAWRVEVGPEDLALLRTAVEVFVSALNTLSSRDPLFSNHRWSLEEDKKRLLEWQGQVAGGQKMTLRGMDAASVENIIQLVLQDRMLNTSFVRFLNERLSSLPPPVIDGLRKVHDRICRM
jgi:hypothetical protein